MAEAVEISAAQARSIALAAQLLGRRRKARASADGGRNGAGVRQLTRIATALGAVQIDAVNVLTRSHYLPFYSRLGPYPTDTLDRLAYRERRLFEYWGHAASLLPVGLYPALRWRMEEYAQSRHYAAFRERIDRERPGYLQALHDEIAERGPLAYTELTDPARWRTIPAQYARYAESSLAWHRQSDGKSALEWMYRAGTLAIAQRRGFQPRYDLAERVVPAEVISASAPRREDAQRSLVLVAARALGVATASDLADYFRLPVAVTRARARELAEQGTLIPARVIGWTQGAYLDPAADGARANARTLLSPFDSLIWYRDRAQRLFGYNHVFELYVTAHKRRFGYYVLPFLAGDRIAARVDLKAARGAGALQVLASYLEPGAPAESTARELAAELRSVADWLGLDSVEVAPRGDLASYLRDAVASAVGSP